MDQLVINVKTRKETGKKAAKVLRTTGRLPAVMYNTKGESTMIDVDEAEFNKVWRTITPTTLVTLKLDGKTSYSAFIKDTEYNILSDRVLHADFYVVEKDTVITTNMKIKLEGTPTGVLKGGFMVTHTPKLKIQAPSAVYPERISIDVSGINIGETFRVKDMKLEKGVKVMTDAETPLVSVSPAR
ncbi:MAG: 50S ribosomal protein L25 [Treponema sp.]|jgi:large subunit ribosomal protein L25|nr:50S ribosomal protein L25 [Treponema sp.]